MADTVGQQEIRGLDIDKLVKGFALREYVFKNFASVSSTSALEIRWYQETAADLTATSPSTITTAPLATFPTIEPSWTRNTSYVKKYAAENFLSMEDIKDNDIDILARTLLRLTRAVVKQVDTRIWNVLTQSQAPDLSSTSIHLVEASGTGWDDGTNGNPIRDIMSGVAALATSDYDTSNWVIAMTPTSHKDLLNYIITTKGSSIPQFSSEKVRDGTVMNILGGRVIVSNNVTADFAAIFIPQKSVTWKTFTPTTARTIEEVGLGTKVRVWEVGEAILTDPKSVALIQDIVT